MDENKMDSDKELIILEESIHTNAEGNNCLKEDDDQISLNEIKGSSSCKDVDIVILDVSGSNVKVDLKQNDNSVESIKEIINVEDDDLKNVKESNNVLDDYPKDVQESSAAENNDPKNVKESSNVDDNLKDIKEHSKVDNDRENTKENISVDDDRENTKESIIVGDDKEIAKESIIVEDASENVRESGNINNEKDIDKIKNLTVTKEQKTSNMTNKDQDNKDISKQKNNKEHKKDSDKSNKKKIVYTNYSRLNYVAQKHFQPPKKKESTTTTIPKVKRIKMEEDQEITVLSEVKKKEEEKEDIDYNEPDRSKGDFYCRLCDCHVNTVLIWQSHVSGKRHKKNLSKGPDENPSKVKFSVCEANAMFYDKMKDFNGPIVGLGFVTEFRRLNSLEPIYTCFLCQGTQPLSQFLTHVSSTKHRLAYIKKMDPEGDEMISGLRLKGLALDNVVEERSSLLQRKHGTGKIEVKMEKGTDDIFVEQKEKTNEYKKLTEKLEINKQNVTTYNSFAYISNSEIVNKCSVDSEKPNAVRSSSSEEPKTANKISMNSEFKHITGSFIRKKLSGAQKRKRKQILDLAEKVGVTLSKEDLDSVLDKQKSNKLISYLAKLRQERRMQHRTGFIIANNSKRKLIKKKLSSINSQNRSEETIHQNVKILHKNFIMKKNIAGNFFTPLSYVCDSKRRQQNARFNVDISRGEPPTKPQAKPIPKIEESWKQRAEKKVKSSYFEGRYSDRSRSPKSDRSRSRSPRRSATRYSSPPRSATHYSSPPRSATHYSSPPRRFRSPHRRYKSPSQNYRTISNVHRSSEDKTISVRISSDHKSKRQIKEELILKNINKRNKEEEKNRLLRRMEEIAYSSPAKTNYEPKSYNSSSQPMDSSYNYQPAQDYQPQSYSTTPIYNCAPPQPVPPPIPSPYVASQNYASVAIPQNPYNFSTPGFFYNSTTANFSAPSTETALHRSSSSTSFVSQGASTNFVAPGTSTSFSVGNIPPVSSSISSSFLSSSSNTIPFLENQDSSSASKKDNQDRIEKLLLSLQETLSHINSKKTHTSKLEKISNNEKHQVLKALSDIEIRRYHSKDEKDSEDNLISTTEKVQLNLREFAKHRLASSRNLDIQNKFEANDTRSSTRSSNPTMEAFFPNMHSQGTSYERSQTSSDYSTIQNRNEDTSSQREGVWSRMNETPSLPIQTQYYSNRYQEHMNRNFDVSSSDPRSSVKYSKDIYDPFSNRHRKF